MPTYDSSIQSLRKVFRQGFIVQDVAEPLISFDGEASAARVREIMTAKRLEVAGVRKEGVVIGFVSRADLETGTCIGSVREFDESLIVLDSTPLGDLILRLKGVQRLFVSILGRIGGIVSRSDLQKPPVRMWLFGIVTLIEMRFARLIEELLPNEQWRQFLSDGRLQKAKHLRSERLRRRQDVSLLDCLQLSDKVTIVRRHPRLREMTQFESKRQLETMAKKLERLRNNLAHSQDIIAEDWETIVILADRLDFVLERENLAAERPAIDPA